MTSKPRGPKAVTWDWQELQAYDDETYQYYELTERQAAALLSVASEQMSWSTRWFSRPLESIWRAFQVDTAQRLMCPVQPPVGGGGDGGQPGHIVYIEEEGDMPYPFTLKRTAVGYVLVYDCGCGDLLEFPLGAPSLASGGTGNSAFDGGGFPPSLSGGVPLSRQECYATAAGDLVIETVKAFAGNIIDALNGGLDALPEGTDVVEAVAWLVDATTEGDNYASLVGLAKSTINDALDNYKTVIANNWEVSGEATRIDLIRLTQYLPIFDGLVPISYIYDRWAQFGNVRAFNARLALNAAECIQGNSGALPPPGTIIVPPVAGYRIIDAQVPVQTPTPGQWTTIISNIGNAKSALLAWSEIDRNMQYAVNQGQPDEIAYSGAEYMNNLSVRLQGGTAVNNWWAANGGGQTPPVPACASGDWSGASVDRPEWPEGGTLSVNPERNVNTLCAVYLIEPVVT